MLDNALFSLQEAARDLSMYFWDVLYRPYPGEAIERPLVHKQAHAVIESVFELIQQADWTGLAAWMKRYAKSLRDKRLPDVEGNTVMMLWMKMLHGIENGLATPLAQTFESIGPAREFTANWHQAIRIVSAAWPKLLDRADLKGQTPLMMAADKGDETMVRALLEAGANEDLQDYFGRTALHVAAAARSLEGVEALLAARPDVWKVTVDEGHTPLHTAVRCGHPQVVRLLLSYEPGLKDRGNVHDQPPVALAEAILTDLPGFRAAMAAPGLNRKTGDEGDYREILALLS